MIEKSDVFKLSWMSHGGKLRRLEKSLGWHCLYLLWRWRYRRGRFPILSGEGFKLGHRRVRHHHTIPRMNIFEGIEKWINEHGSAEILRERLALAKEQHDAETGALRAERDKVTAERDVLSTRLKDAQIEVQRLKHQAERLKPRDGLEELEVSILKLLAEARYDLTAQDVARSLGAVITKVEFYLTKLEQGGFIGGTHYYTGQAPEYSIAHAGRGYLIQRGLV